MLRDVPKTRQTASRSAELRVSQRVMPRLQHRGFSADLSMPLGEGGAARK